MKRLMLSAASVLAAFSTFTLVLSIASTADVDQEQVESQQYCELVQLWKDSNGKHGHPAYRGQQECR